MTGSVVRPAGKATPPLFNHLSPREREVLDGIVQGLTNRAIGEALGISHRTVEIHRARLMRKLNATSFASLIAIALGQRSDARSGPSERKDRC
ncbi:MAG: hypothetical protein BGN95_08385 [Sphingomonas sp. 66-10]|nr:MAG: hypothetical protein BGN95_08385 [Sphingomonas sp. 66-10]